MVPRKFRDGRLEVVACWNLEKKGFSLVIKDLEARADDPRGGLVFSNSRIPRLWLLIEDVDVVVHGLGLTVPDDFLLDLRYDQINAGSEVYEPYEYPRLHDQEDT